MKISDSFLSALVLFGAAAAFGQQPSAKVAPKEIFWDRELIITHRHPVETWQDPKGGRFTLKHLLAGLASDGNPETAARQWLNSWVSDQVVEKNGKPVVQTLAVGSKLLQRWEGLARTGPECPPAGQLCFKHAPFRLLAIVNRPDKQQRDKNFQPHSAGEVRFIFGLTDEKGRKLDATVIFEYDMPAQNLAEVYAWQYQWHQLLKHPPFGDDYCGALADITEKVVGRNAPTNRSALLHIRTNERDLSELGVGGYAVWNLREFNLDGMGAIVATPTEKTPSSDLANDPLLVKYINNEEDNILLSHYDIPPVYGGRVFLGSQANLPRNPQKPFWLPDEIDQPGKVNPAARARFALNTCNGCHGYETRSTIPVHIKPRPAGVPSGLSRFLDSTNGDTTEILERKKFMCAALNSTPVPTTLSSLWTTTPKDAASWELLYLLIARAGRAH